MPNVALGLRPPKDLGLSEPDYALEAPVTIDFPGVPGPMALNVVTARMHHLSPVGAMKDDPEIVAYYIGQSDHLLYKLTAAYKLSPTEWDTRTELINGMEVNKATDPDDFKFTPPPGSRAVGDTSDLFPQDNVMHHDFLQDLHPKP